MTPHRMLSGTLRLVPVLWLAAGCTTNGNDHGQPAPAPAPGGEQITISPSSGTTSTRVTVTAAGFQPGTPVRIGFGPPESEYEVIDTVPAGASGRVSASVSVPEWADERGYVFVAVGPDGNELVSDRFTVRAAQPGDELRVTGVLTDEGVECPALRTDRGKLYTLAGSTASFRTGDRVTVEGKIAEVSVCMQGTTIAVESIQPAG